MIRSLIALLAAAFPIAAAEEPAFRYDLNKKDDTVRATAKDGTTTFAVTCPSGIGGATITRTGQEWPKTVVLRLNLGALEGFNAVAGKWRMHALVNTSSMKSVSYKKDGKEVEGYGPKHPLWTEIKIFNADGTARDITHLEKGGWFEVHLPKEFFEGNPASFSFDWIDYYRR
jgi:hypothetical protein